MFPTHLWLPEAHVEAPTEGSIVLASLLLKLGGYGFIRWLIPLFPEASQYFSPLVYTLCVLAIIHASLTALRQVDLKKIVAYSSVAHMSLAVLGIFSFTFQGIHGSVFLMLAHGLVSGALFLLIGVLYDRYHTRLITYYGGLAQTMPVFSSLFLLFTLANISLPGTCNFVGELLVFVGIFEDNSLIALISGLGIVLSAAYSIWLCNRLIFTSLNTKYIPKFMDINAIEMQSVAPLAFLAILFGIFPSVILNYTTFSVLYFFNCF